MCVIFPCSECDDRMGATPPDPKFPTNIHQSHSSCVKASHLRNHGLCKSSLSTSLSVGHPSFIGRVHSVSLVVPEKQVIRIDTRRIVALVADRYFRIKCSIVDFPRKSVRKDVPWSLSAGARFVGSQSTVSMIVRWSIPNPARICFCDVVPESFFNRLGSAWSMFSTALPTATNLVDDALIFLLEKNTALWTLAWSHTKLSLSMIYEGASLIAGALTSLNPIKSLGFGKAFCGSM
jgi:hypothetical protein